MYLFEPCLREKTGRLFYHVAKPLIPSYQVSRVACYSFDGNFIVIRISFVCLFFFFSFLYSQQHAINASSPFYYALCTGAARTLAAPFPNISENLLISFFQSVSQSVRMQCPLTSAATHSTTQSLYSLLRNLFYFIALSRLKKLKIGASVAQSVQRLRYRLNCRRFESNQQQDTSLFSKSPARLPVSLIFTGHREGSGWVASI